MQVCKYDATLIFPPFMETAQPHLAIPYLTAYLQKCGYHIIYADFNLKFWSLCRDRGFLEFLRQLFISEIHRLKREGVNINNYDSYFEKNLALMAAQNLLRTSNFPNCYAESQPFSKKVFALIAGLGFHTLYNNDYRDFLDDLLVFLGATKIQRDDRVIVRPNSTISQQISEREISDKDKNLYLSIYEKFFLKDFHGLEAPMAGISIATNEQVIPALSLAWAIKSVNSKIHICLGGSYISHIDRHSMETILRMPFINSMVLDEGEMPLKLLIEAVKSNNNIYSVPNLAYWDKGEIKVNSVGETVHLDRVPPPNYEGIIPFFPDELALSVYSSRGCYWGKCVYCNYISLTGKSKYLQNKSPRILVDEIEFLNRKYGARHFNLINEAVAPLYASKIADFLAERALKVNLSSWIRVEKHFTPELCRKMAAVNFNLLTLGIESLSDRVLEKMGKGYAGDDAVRVIRNVCRAGINLQINVIVGLPTETRQEAIETYTKLGREIAGKSNIFLSIFPFVLFNNSAIYLRPREFGLTILENKAKDGYFYPKNIFVKYQKDIGMSLKDVFEVMQMYAAGHDKGYEYYDDAQYMPPPNSIYYYSENVESHFIDFYSPERGRIERCPKYIVFDFSRGKAMTYTNTLRQKLVKK